MRSVHLVSCRSTWLVSILGRADRYPAIPTQSGQTILPEAQRGTQAKAPCSMPVVDDILPEIARAKVFSVLDLKSGFWQTDSGMFAWMNVATFFNFSEQLSPGTVGLFFIRFARVKYRLKGLSFT